MPDYIIKDIPADKMKDFKTACANMKVTMRQVFLDTIDIIITTYKQEIGQLKGKPKPTKKKEAK